MKDRTRDGIRTKQTKATEEAVMDKGTYGLHSDRCVAFIQIKVFTKPVSAERFCESCKMFAYSVLKSRTHISDKSSSLSNDQVNNQRKMRTFL